MTVSHQFVYLSSTKCAHAFSYKILRVGSDSMKGLQKELTPLLYTRCHGLHKHHRTVLDCYAQSMLSIFLPPFSHPQLQWQCSSEKSHENNDKQLRQ